ncbi:MAG: hypothetical protein LUE86_05740 [Clostridiales bacterium]|nr:hypothetical protein [Clostridiales bacterium]
MKKLIYDKLTENLIEISQAYVCLLGKHQKLSDIDSTTWKQQFVDWANEFEEMYPDPGYWDEHDYLETIEKYAKDKILEYGGIKLVPVYFTFGSWEKFPYQNAYVIVYAEDKRQAIAKFRERFPDINEGVVNCSAWYTQQEVNKCKLIGLWYKGEPAEIIR